MKYQFARRSESQSHSTQHLDRQPTKGASFLRTCLNGVNALSGVGILSIPFALSQGGWLTLPLLFLVSTLCCYTGLLLRRCMDAEPLVKTYPDIGALAFGRTGRALVSAVIHLELYLVAVEFLILEGDNLNKLFPNTDFHVGVGAGQCFVVLAAVVVLPTAWLRSMKVLAYLSAGGVVASWVLVGCVVWVGGVDGVGFEENGVLWRWSGVATAVSLYTFCYSGHAVFPTLSNSIKDRSQFPKVLLVCFAVGTITYASMAIPGYLMFGDKVMSQVTLNLPTHKLSSKIAIYTTLINPIAKYSIIVSPIFQAIEDAPPFGKSRFMGILVRTVVVISTAVVALTIPFFGYVMAFIGSFLSVCASVLFPCLCYLKIYKVHQCFGPELVLIVGIIVMGLVVAVTGTYTSVKEIVKHWRAA
ncbi:hypothetical protein NMG60_11009218 [Bertholletia excelsa]